MASNFKLRRFSSPATLKSISAPLLIEFLAPYRPFLEARGLDVSGPADLDYDALANILMSPDENTPDAMLDALFFVDEMSLPALYEDLITEAHAEKIDLGNTDELTPADLAVRIWMAKPSILERLHAERFLVKPKSFRYFLSTTLRPDDLSYPSDETIKALEEQLNDWFETKKRGRGTRVFPFFREDGIWFLVRHGEPYKREGTLENGESSSVFYRPEKFDVLIYSLNANELAIHAGTKGERTIYCKAFGFHLFGSETFFDYAGMFGRFTLDPIRDDWRQCVACTDVDGIVEVRLTELQIQHDSVQSHVEIHRANDVFTAFEDLGRHIPAGAELIRAKFMVTFSDAVRARTVVIQPSNATIFDRESDSELLYCWMTARGFLRAEVELSDDGRNTALAVS